ncbi:MAG: NAD(P)/FAD-dependent oxidoreductase [Pirellulaceae bacterium]
MSLSFDLECEQEMNNASPSVLVIGGGVAGSSCALSLARLGMEVHVAEKSEFPRDKACGCCIGPAGLAAIDQLGLHEQTKSLSVPVNRWLGSFNARQVDLAIPAGIAIARTVLDPLMLDAARQAGASVALKCTASVRANSETIGDHVVVDMMHNGSVETKCFDVVVIAAGLSFGGLDAILPWQQSPHGPFGAACRIRDPLSSIKPGTIYMACDDDGYVGIVCLADGTVDVAGALRSGAQAARLGSPLCRIKQIIDRSSFDLPDVLPLSGVITTPMLRRTRKVGNGRVIAIGDTAGYVEPFTGEGMTWAMQSGIAAANLIAAIGDHSQTGDHSQLGDLSTLGDQWQSESSRLLGQQKLICKIVTNACRSGLMRSSIAKALGTFPSLASPLLKSLSRVPM